MRLDNGVVLVVALAIGVLAVARVVRLVVDDDYPPMVRVREWYVGRAPLDWQPLMECPWCCAPYIALPAVLWFASLFAWPGATWNLYLWWILNGWAAVAWAAAWINLRDIPPENR